MPTARRDGLDPVSTDARGRGWVLTLVIWSLFVWGTRIDNIVGDAALDGPGRAWRLALAGSFVVLAAVVGVRWRHRRGPSDRAVVARMLAWWTLGVWIVRSVGIALGGHDVGFVIVHLVLAVVSIMLAVLVLRSTSPATGPPT